MVKKAKVKAKTPRRVLVLMHEDLVPPDDVEQLSPEQVEPLKTEYHVVTGLGRLGHEVRKLGVSNELLPLRDALAEWQPHIVFNLLEEFHGEPMYDQNVVGFLELMRVPYTGCNPRGLVLARDKALSKKILLYHRIRTPRFAVARRGSPFKRPRPLEFPLIVKSLIFEASAGIARASVVHSDDKLAERVRFIHENLHTHAIVEQYVDGRELYVGVMGNRRLTVLPIWELHLDKLPADAPRIATSRVKHDAKFQEKHAITDGPALGLTPEQVRHVEQLSKRIYRVLELTGYARLDFRMDAEGQLFFLEANPNPQIAADEEFAAAVGAAGMTYDQMLERIVGLGLAWAE
jgi:D-alanine-D-alanine ligase